MVSGYVLFLRLGYSRKGKVKELLVINEKAGIGGRYRLLSYHEKLIDHNCLRNRATGMFNCSRYLATVLRAML